VTESLTTKALMLLSEIKELEKYLIATIESRLAALSEPGGNGEIRAINAWSSDLPAQIERLRGMAMVRLAVVLTELEASTTDDAIRDALGARLDGRPGRLVLPTEMTFPDYVAVPMPRCNGMPSIGQNSGISMSSILKSKTVPCALARPRAPVKRFLRGSLSALLAYCSR
jgi:hypothetical protein